MTKSNSCKRQLAPTSEVSYCFRRWGKERFFSIKGLALLICCHFCLPTPSVWWKRGWVFLWENGTGLIYQKWQEISRYQRKVENRRRQAVRIKLKSHAKNRIPFSKLNLWEASNFCLCNRNSRRDLEKKIISK